MQYKLLSVEGERETNIGDYIQALASRQFLPHVDGFINREELKSYQGEDSKMIMNGWFMHHPEQWPPSEKIHPLFVAFHINELAKDTLLSDESIAYLKAHEPIGCRDTHTTDMLKAKGVKAYFSGCMTLTLGYSFTNNSKTDDVYFVDPYFKTDWNVKEIVRNAFYLLFHYSSVSKIAYKYPSNKRGLRKKMILVAFYREYRKFFSKKTLLDGTYINQQSHDIMESLPTNEDRMKEAERLVRLYAKAKFVVTSRIHCALPCLGLGTPVLYVEDINQSVASSCRLGGLIELMNVAMWNRGCLEVSEDLKRSIRYGTLRNKPLGGVAKVLIKKCLEFVKEN